MRAIALIPARLGATRFPSKLLAPLKGKSVIRRTFESAMNTGLFDEVIVVTDSDEILDEIIKNGGKAIKSKRAYESGTDRIAEVAADMEAEGHTVQVASLVQQLTDPLLIEDPNYVKVALGLNNNALFFSRSVIPYLRNKELEIPYYEHIGVYAFRKQALMDFTNWPLTSLEAAEKIECLRFLEHGISIKMAITKYMGVEIDTPADIIKAEQLMEKNGWK